MSVPTRTQVNHAGRLFRRWYRGEVISEADLSQAYELIVAWRACHEYSLVKANMGLRSAVSTENCRLEVSQRLKRIPTILDKIRREPTMQLANMQDIGGCRAVLESVGEVRRVQRRLVENRTRKGAPPLRVADYISKPRSSGYRAVHVIVTYPDRDGEPRGIEVQLRTRLQHDWAITVERLSGRLRHDFKSGVGPQPVLDLLEAISEAMAIEEAGGEVHEAQMGHLRNLRQAAVPFLG